MLRFWVAVLTALAAVGATPTWSPAAVLIPIGFAVLAVAALVSGATSPWVTLLLLVGVLLIGFPDGAEIVNLGAAITMAAGLVPFGVTMMFQ